MLFFNTVFFKIFFLFIFFLIGSDEVPLKMNSEPLIHMNALNRMEINLLSKFFRILLLYISASLSLNFL